jgi:hypothetical protein
MCGGDSRCPNASWEVEYGGCLVIVKAVVHPTLVIWQQQLNDYNVPDCERWLVCAVKGSDWSKWQFYPFEGCTCAIHMRVQVQLSYNSDEKFSRLYVECDSCCNINTVGL